MTDSTDVVYVEHETKLPWPIGLGVIYNKKTREGNDMTDDISLIYTKNNTKLSRPIKPMQSVMNTRQENDVTNLPHAVYTKNETE